MFLKKIHLKSYRNFIDTEIEFKEKITTIIGPNNTGKSNLLDAIFYLKQPERLSIDDSSYFSDSFIKKRYPEISYDIDLKFLDLPEEYNTKVLSISVSDKELISKSKVFQNYKNWDGTLNDFDVTNSVFDKLKKSLGIIFWYYKIENFDLKTQINLKKIKKNPSNYPQVVLLFERAGIKINDFLSSQGHERSLLLAEVNDYMTKLIKGAWVSRNIEFRFDFSPEDMLNFHIYEEGKPISLEKEGDGFKWFFLFLLNLNEKMREKIKNSIILLDEPGDYLHPGAQKLLLKQIELLGQENQVIYTTHSPFMINKLFPERIICLDKQKGKVILKIPKPQEIYDDLLIASVLGFDFSCISRWGEINVFVEGMTDKILIEHLIFKKIKYDGKIILDLNRFVILPIHGLNFLENFIRVAQITESKYLAFIDNDVDAKERIKNYTKPLEQRSNQNREVINHIIQLDDGKIIEDYIPTDLLNKALQILNHSDDIIYNNSLRDCIFTKELKAIQLKNFAKKINEYINHNYQLNEKDSLIETYTKGKLKLDLMLTIKKNNFISNENIEVFKEIIAKIESIQEIAENNEIK